MPREKIERVVLNNMRYYKVIQYSDEVDAIGHIVGIFPSVTTVLGQTGDKFFLKRWEKSIGKENAERITQNAGKRGTVMHRLCEIYLGLPTEMSDADRLEATLIQSNTDKEINAFDNRARIIGGMLFFNFIRAGTFNSIKQNFVTEKFLWTERSGGYAGTVDNVSMMLDDTYSVIDFKTALKPKDESYIEDYKRQVGAYAVAVFDRVGVKVESANIMISNEKSHIPQIFRMDRIELKKYYLEFVQRLKNFYEKFPPLDEGIVSSDGDLF